LVTLGLGFAGVRGEEATDVSETLDQVTVASRRDDGESLKVLLGALSDQNQHVRRAAALGLIDRGARDAEPRIVSLVEGAEGRPDLDLIFVAGRLQYSSALPHLRALATHADRRVRRAALLALAEFGEPFREALAGRELSSLPPRVRARAILALGAGPANEACARVWQASRNATVAEAPVAITAVWELERQETQAINYLRETEARWTNTALDHSGGPGYAPTKAVRHVVKHAVARVEASAKPTDRREADGIPGVKIIKEAHREYSVEERKGRTFKFPTSFWRPDVQELFDDYTKVTTVAERLSHPNAQVRFAAVKSKPPELTKPLIHRAFIDRYRLVRQRAAKHLDQSDVPFLMSFMVENQTTEMRNLAMMTLARLQVTEIGPQIPRWLSEGWVSPDYACGALRRLKRQVQPMAILRWLGSENRAEICLGLMCARYQPVADADEAVERLLSHPQPSVRVEALRTLPKYWTTPLDGDLLLTLRRLYAEDRNFRVKRAAKDALARMPAADAQKIIDGIPKHARPTRRKERGRGKP